MTPTGPQGSAALRQRLAELLVEVAIIQRAQQHMELVMLRNAAARASVMCDDLAGICDGALARSDEARWRTNGRHSTNRPPAGE